MQKILISKQTITFKGSNSNNINDKIKTLNDILPFNVLKHIIDNAKKSKANNEMYVFRNIFQSLHNKKNQLNIFNNVFDNIRAWAIDKEIISKGDLKTQYVKFQEEGGELAKALLENNQKEIKDAIGDIVVVLTNLATLNNFTIEECIESAYNEIKNRKGKIVNGTFKKN
jgi:NTP pyrophosphatase (non-canonical NTP hydrolase)